LYIAVSEKNVEMAEMLLDGRCNPNVVTRDGDSAMLAACRLGLTSIVPLLLLEGANPNQCNRAGATPLHWAVRNGMKDIAAALLVHGADPFAENARGTNCVHAASLNGHTDMIELLMSAERGVPAVKSFLAQRDVSLPYSAPYMRRWDPLGRRAQRRAEYVKRKQDEARGVYKEVPYHQAAVAYAAANPGN
jgi:ankyrin repeat protein